MIIFLNSELILLSNRFEIETGRGMYLETLKDFLSLVGAFLAIALVLYLSYRFSKFMATRFNDMGSKGNIKILERVALGQDKGLAVAQISGKYYLLGISNNGISLLMDMPDYTPLQPQELGKNFGELFKENLANRKAKKAGGKDGTDS